MNIKTFVLKAGGSSVKQPDRLARWLQKEYEGDRIILVVSAPPGRTDELTRQFRQYNEPVRAAIRDALLAVGEQESMAHVAAALEAAGMRAIPIPPWEVFSTDGEHGNARILEVNLHPIRTALEEGDVPVIGGFLGRGPDGRICTLGRGGSDYSAVALAAELGCPVHLLKADVDGVYSADPRTDSDATRFDLLSFDRAVVLAREGAKVIQVKAAELARTRGVGVWVRRTFVESQGTWIGFDPSWDRISTVGSALGTCK